MELRLRWGQIKPSQPPRRVARGARTDRHGGAKSTCHSQTYERPFTVLLDKDGQARSLHCVPPQRSLPDAESFHTCVNEAHAAFLARLETWRNADVQSTTELASRLDIKDRELLMRVEDLWEMEESALQRRLADLKEWLGEVQESKSKSPKPRVPKPGEKIVGTDPRYRRP